MAKFRNGVLYFINDVGSYGIYKNSDLVTPADDVLVVDNGDIIRGIIDNTMMVYIKLNAKVVHSYNGSVERIEILSQIPSGYSLYMGNQKNSDGWYLFNLFGGTMGADDAPITSVILIKPK